MNTSCHEQTRSRIGLVDQSSQTVAYRYRTSRAFHQTLLGPKAGRRNDGTLPKAAGKRLLRSVRLEPACAAKSERHQ